MSAQCYCFAGLGYPFFAGGTSDLSKLINDLNGNIKSSHHPFEDWKKVRDALIKAHKANPSEAQIFLVGHSFGCLKIINLARDLEKHAIPIRYVAAIDPTKLPSNEPPMTVTPNIRIVDEFWSTKGGVNFPLYARTKDPSGKLGGMYVYPNGWPGQKRILKVNAGHIPIASATKTRDTILASITELVAPAAGS